MRKLLALIVILGLAACAAEPPQQATLDVEKFIGPETTKFEFKSNGPEAVAVRWKGQVVGLVRPGEAITVEIRP